MIKGDTPPNAKDGFPGLQSPKWPERHSAADRREAGGARAPNSTRHHCQECHRPPVSSAAFFDFDNKDWWTKNEAGEPILDGRERPDLRISAPILRRPRTWATERSRFPPISDIKSSSFAFALGERGREDRQLRLRPAEAAGVSDRGAAGSIDGYMPNELRGELAYKVRPLNGVWATPPYLHNGSVPTIERSAWARRRTGRRNSISATANTIP